MPVSVAKDGRALILDDGWAASRDASGRWERGIAFSAVQADEEFFLISDADASPLLKEAREALPESSQPKEGGEMSVSNLPVFDQGSRFWDVEGDAVSESKGGVRIWRDGKPEPFPLELALKGVVIDEARFRALVKASEKGIGQRMDTLRRKGYSK